MWIMTSDGFISAVEHDTDPDVMRVRARTREHLVRWLGFGDDEVIDLGADAPDYRWHADVDRDYLADLVYSAVMDVDYTSHAKENMTKADADPDADDISAMTELRGLRTGHDEVYYTALLETWRAMRRLQEREEESCGERPRT